MSRLVRLYPRAWRGRYEAEFEALLEDRPPTLADRLDIVRGAIDARVHPQVPAAADAAPPMPWTNRLPGLIALSAGVLWSGVYLAWALAIGWSAGADWAWSGYPGLALILMFVSLPGDYMAAYGRRIAQGIGLIAGGVVVMNFVPWSIALVVLAGVATIAFGGMLTLAGIRAGLGAPIRWVLLWGTLIVPVAIGLMIGQLVDWTPAAGIWPQFLMVVPYGLAWIALGIVLIVRGAPTIVDIAVPAPEPETPAR